MGARSARVLVVDDEFSLRRTLTIALRAAGYQVTSAANGVETVDRLRLTTFDVVITDLTMPGMTGIELLKAIKRRSPETEVIRHYRE
jgi:CheY-like chemotaxis protein